MDGRTDRQTDRRRVICITRALQRCCELKIDKMIRSNPSLKKEYLRFFYFDQDFNFLFHAGCKEEWKWFVGNEDAFCDDFVNTANCNFDGGDCCGPDVKDNYCTECICYESSSCSNELLPLIGNGYCDDETNTVNCNYDGGDCCGACVNTDHCSECACHDEGASHPSIACNNF